MMERIQEEVSQILGADKSGHSVDHVERVHRLSMEFSAQEQADPEVVSLIAWLHDVDDYKIFGRESAENLTNAKAILDRHSIDQKIAQQVLQAIPLMGYNNYLDGRRPNTIEGMIVSDADMCDAIGTRGLIRVFEYNASKNRPFLVKTIPPVKGDMDGDQYRADPNAHAVQHFFDKLLKIPGILLTESGREEGARRSQIMEDFLREMFREEDAQDWMRYLDEFLASKP